MIRYSRNPRFKCGTAKLTDHYGCHDYTILQSDIEHAVLASVRAFAVVLIDREQMKLALLEREKASASELETKIRSENKTAQLLENSVTKLFTEFASGKLTKDAFLHKKAIVNDTVARKRETIAQMTERLRALTVGRSAVENSVAELTPLTTIDALDREIVDLLIDKILVRGEHDIEIVWLDKFAGSE
jgi:hypothetical protein